jgi:hypothetical protein
VEEVSGALRRIGLGLFVALAAFASLLLRGDGPPPRDADLMASPAAPVAEHENGFVSLQAAGEVLRWPDDASAAAQLVAMASGERWDEAVAARVISANERALATFARVAGASSFRSPPGAAEMPAAFAHGVRLAQLRAIAAVAAAQRGEGDAALAGGLELLRIARRIDADPNGGGNPAAAAYVVGSTGLAALEASLPRLSLAPESARALAAELGSLHTDPAVWRERWAAVYREERLHPRVSAAGIASERGPWAALARHLPARFLLRPNDFARLLATRVRALQADVGTACAPRAPRPPLSLLELLRGNAVGRRYAAHTPELESLDASRCAFDTRLEAVRASVALRAFEAERGGLPPSLEALVPQWLDGVPRDWFGSGALRFDRARRLLWSLGSDGEDDGGTGASDDPTGIEIRLALPAPAALRARP